MKSVSKAVVTVVAAGMLAACGGGGAGGGDSAGKNNSSPSAEKSPTPSVKAPKGFDTSKGWQQTVSWPDDQGTTLPVGAAPEAGVVAFLQKRGADYVVEARDAVTGAPRWSGKAWQPPAPGKNVAADASHLPQLLVVNHDDREYIAVWAHAPSFTEGEGTFSLLLYPADSSGKEISPARTFSVPMDADGKPTVVDDMKGIAVRWEESNNTPHTTSIDLSTARVTTYDEVELPCGEDVLGPCRGEVEALSSDGPVVQLGAFGGFGVPGVWHAGDAVPPGGEIHNSKYKSGRVMDVLGGQVLLTSWFLEDGLGNESVKAVHDLKSGKLVASTPCKSDSERSYSPALSPDGRYAVWDTVAVDLEKGKAYCFAEGVEDEEFVHLVSVADGIAYGYTGPSGDFERVRVSVTLDTGKVEKLPQGTEVPSLLLPKAGGFSLQLADDNVAGRQFIFHPRR
ncbi:hypothetical protein [Streptomyces sp. NPDC047985]|uniref:hypothetical protein n=1 Tax=unclassified Streptomyces TaxID=2593676 RepID=UPI00342019DC